MKKVIKYRLNANGTIPTFLYLGSDGVGGMYSFDTKDHAPPQELLLIGISIDNPVVGEFEVIPTKADLESYLISISAGWTYCTKPGTNPIPFDPVTAATYVWDRLNALNTK
jgi:hypothetical protein